MIKPLKNYMLLAACVAVVALCGPAQAQSTDLKWNLSEGDQFEVTLTQNSNSETKVDARETTVDSTSTIQMDWEVRSVADNGDATIEQSLRAVKLSVTGFTRKKKGATASPLLTVRFDTAAPAGATKESKKLMNQVQPLLGLKFDVVMSPSGQIKQVDVPPELAAQLEKMPDTQKLRALFSEQGLADIMGAAAVVIPKDLAQGDSWSVESTPVTEMGTFERKRTYTFVGEKTISGTRMAEFSVDVSLEPKAAEPDQASNTGLESKLIDFSGTGVLMLDVDEGFFATSRNENRIHTEKPYREKTIETVATNLVETTVKKK